MSESSDRLDRIEKMIEATNIAVAKRWEDDTRRWEEEAKRREEEANRREEEAKRREEEQAKSNRKFDQKFEEIRKQSAENSKQIGGIGDKFGYFTEGLALPSMEKILYGQFQMEWVSPRIKRKKDDQSMEIDVLAWANSDVNKVYVVEVKSRLRKQDLNQLLKILKKLPQFMPEHKNKAIHGILAFVDGPKDLQKEILKKGIYLARISNDTFRLDVPKDFQPRAF